MKYEMVPLCYFNNGWFGSFIFILFYFLLEMIDCSNSPIAFPTNWVRHSNICIGLDLRHASLGAIEPWDQHKILISHLYTAAGAITFSHQLTCALLYFPFSFFLKGVLNIIKLGALVCSVCWYKGNSLVSIIEQFYHKP